MSLENLPEMSFIEVKKETENALRNLYKLTNEWSARDVLRRLSEFGFWKGSSFASIDEATAKQLLDAAMVAVKEDDNGNIVYDVHELIQRFARREYE